MNESLYSVEYEHGNVMGSNINLENALGLVRVLLVLHTDEEVIGYKITRQKRFEE